MVSLLRVYVSDKEVGKKKKERLTDLQSRSSGVGQVSHIDLQF